ncbi:hypothetical protein NliqN6_5965 [Naganishia liquefaciens]|uniref:Uncharacterized protein n=1 Tax=Naganishia liquefaciens TaxID=104408 RepID=A0A8H3TYT9_9TREE|nr:hypothetical protein NliqN6_5965 [Naganishia liquefaciens]
MSYIGFSYIAKQENSGSCLTSRPPSIASSGGKESDPADPYRPVFSTISATPHEWAGMTTLRDGYTVTFKMTKSKDETPEGVILNLYTGCEISGRKWEWGPESVIVSPGDVLSFWKLWSEAWPKLLASVGTADEQHEKLEHWCSTMTTFPDATLRKPFEQFQQALEECLRSGARA